MGRALLDAVTGMATCPQLLAVIDKELARASRRESTLALIMADIDGFGELNDRWGHDTGNHVLETFAEVLRSILRREDSAARFGADEFVCVLPGADRDQAAAVAARIQQRFSANTSGDQGLGRSGVDRLGRHRRLPRRRAGCRRRSSRWRRTSSTQPSRSPN